LIKSWQPLLRGESIRPGTAKTCRPYSVAKFAVINAPLVRFASTTTVPRVMPATMRCELEGLLVCGAVERETASRRRRCGDAFKQFGVLGREDEVDAGAEDGDGAAFCASDAPDERPCIECHARRR
jgi:hypothetical protein